MRFLHLADLHLDTSFATRSQTLAGRLRSATREALSRAVDRALAEEVDAVLIAGDLFDGDRLSFRTERFLLESLARLTTHGIAVVYATGNHDPGGTAGPASRIPWPTGVHLLSGPEAQRIPIVREGRRVGWVTGAGHDSPRVDQDLSRGFPRPDGELPEVGLLHTQVVGSRGAENHDRYAPSELTRLQASGFDYWALGHIHQPQALSTDPAIHYPGNLQGRHPGEAGPRGGLLVDVERGRPATVRFVELAPVRWESLEIGDLEAVTHPGAAVEKIRRAWDALRKEEPGLPGTEWVARLELAGPSPLFAELRDEQNRRDLSRDVQATLDLLEVEVRTARVLPMLDPASHRDRPDVVGASLRLMERIRTGEEPDAAEALGISAEDLAGASQGSLDDYLRRLLDDQENRLLAALLGRENER
jgi:DNA repair protein SbcD/Mre11